MKKHLFFVVFATFLVSKLCLGDIVSPNTHYVEKCIKITNIDDYPGIALIGYSFLQNTLRNVVELSSSECLDKGYRFNGYLVYAVNKSYLDGKTLEEIKYPDDPNVLPSSIPIDPSKDYVDDSNPVIAIEQFYKIAGFTNATVVLYKWKEITRFNSGKPDSTKTYTYDGESSTLSQEIAVGINSQKKMPVIEVYPNPATKNVHVRVNNSYKGTVPLSLITEEGKAVKSFKINKAGSLLDYDIPVANVAKGVYFVKLQFGKNVQYKKVVIK